MAQTMWAMLLSKVVDILFMIRIDAIKIPVKPPAPSSAQENNTQSEEGRKVKEGLGGGESARSGRGKKRSGVDSDRAAGEYKICHLKEPAFSLGGWGRIGH